jgi:multidrug resistance efflux pump
MIAEKRHETAGTRSPEAGFEGFRFSTGAIAPPESRLAVAMTAPPPVPIRPGGRIRLGLLLLCVFGLAGYNVWMAFFRYEAYGVVSGDAVQVGAPADGLIRYVTAREGEPVQQGQLLAILHNLEIQHRLERIGDELLLAQATLSAERAELDWRTHVREVEDGQAIAQYHEAWGRFQQESARHAELAADLQRAQSLRGRNVVSDESFERAKYNEQGQRDKLEKLEVALQAWKERAEMASAAPESPAAKLQPALLKIDLLSGDLRRVRELLDRCEIRAPVGGTVLKWHRRAGEMARSCEPLVEILEEGSTHVKLYLTQGQSGLLSVGDIVPVEIAPYSDLIPCRVINLEGRFESAPAILERFYRADEKLLPVTLQPDDLSLAAAGIRPGALVRVPRR